MRLLKQISLDGHTALNLSSSLHSFRTNHNNDFTNSNKFGKNLSEILERNVRLLNLSNHNNNNNNENDRFNANVERSSLLKALEELNSCIVSLIEMCTYSSQSTNNIKDYDKHKSKLRRHYSALVDGGHLFRGKRLQSLNSNGSNEKEAPHDSIYIENVIENSIHKLIESNIFNLLVNSIPNIGFEEKKIARMILTNSLTIDLKKNKIIVDYFCDPSNPILLTLVESYEHGKSDITLNCGCIIRFASQFEPILIKILQSEYFYKFFDYMQRSSSDYPFDVAMDIFYTFKTIMTKHKLSTTNILKNDSRNFFRSLINLLEHAETTEDYVTRRQTLELFSEIFSGQERAELREKFLLENDLICSIIRYIWNRNLQIRLRCLALLSHFFSKDNKKDETLSSTSKDLNSLMKMIRTTYIEFNNNQNNVDNAHSNMDNQLRNFFVELKGECMGSNIKQFTSLTVFVDQLINTIDLTSQNHNDHHL